MVKIKILTVIVLLFVISSSFIVSGINPNVTLKTPLDEPTGFIEWEQTFDSGKWDIGTCIQQTNDGGYICVGHGDGYKILLIKMDNMGNVQWNKYFEHCWPDYARYVLQTGDNGYIVLAETQINDFEHVWLIKTDENGNKEWERFLGFKQESSGYCIQQTSDGGFIISGYTSPMNWLNCYDTWLLKVDALGYEEWNQTFERQWYNKAYSVKQTPDDGYIIVGGKAPTLEGNADIWLIKTDDAGNMQWDKTFGDESTWNVGRCIQLTSDDGYIIAGENLLIKTDADGSEEWSKPIGSMCVQQTTDGGFIITGFKEYWWKETFKNKDLKLIKTDSQGNKEWTRIYGGEYRDAGNFVLQTTDEGYIVVGYTEFPKNYPVQERDVWVIKTGKKPLSNDVSKQTENIPVDHQRSFYSNRVFINLFAKILKQMINLR